MKIVGRKREIRELSRLCASPRPEFLVVYGRRRIGKTFLVREYFNNSLTFYATGVARGTMATQLKAFGLSLREHGDTSESYPKDWFEAFERLKALLKSDSPNLDPVSGKKVVFIDEMPWLDTARSNFKQALDYFWNSYGSSDPKLLLIVCGSATSWVIRNLLRDHGGLHNRVTSRLRLEPFTLAECEEYYAENGLAFSRLQMVESYMIFGGVPFYLDLLDRRMSLAQNVDSLCFADAGALRNEFDELYHSLFKNAGAHIAVIRALSKRHCGLNRAEIERAVGRKSGGTLSRVLEELEQCGFIRRVQNYTAQKRNSLYQLCDPFTLFYLQFIDDGSMDGNGAWLSYLGSPAYHAWTGLAFEMVCAAHIEQIKRALGVLGVASSESGWRSASSDPGAQVDLLIDRADGVINVCEIKYSDVPFSIDKAYDQNLRNKLRAFAQETGTKKSLRLTMISPYGVARNSYWNIVQNEITLDDLF